MRVPSGASHYSTRSSVRGGGGGGFWKSSDRDLRADLGSPSDGAGTIGVATNDFSPGETAVLQEVQRMSDAQHNITQSIHHVLQWQTEATACLQKLARLSSDAPLAPQVDLLSEPSGEHIPSQSHRVRPASRKASSLSRDSLGTSVGYASGNGESAQAAESRTLRATAFSTTSLGEDGPLAPLLPPSWPKVLEPRTIGGGVSAAEGGTATTTTFSRSNVKSFNTPISGRWRRLYSKLVVNPNSWGHRIFSMLLLCVLISDLTLVPFLLAWEVDFVGPWRVLQWFTAVFWTLDIVMNLLTAVFEEGKLNKDPALIFRLYFQSWMVPDVGLVTIDWLALLATLSFDDDAQPVKVVRFVRVGRFLRILSVLRVIKFARMSEEFLHRRVSDVWQVAMKLILLLAFLLWINHLLCCVWWQIGLHAYSDTGSTWFSTVPSDEIRKQVMIYQYVTTFHWAVAQVTLGSNDIYGANSVERCFSSICLIFGLLFGSTLVSSLSASMVQLQMLRNGKVQKLQMVRRFLRDNEVDLEVSYLVQKQVKQRLTGHEKLSEKDVPALALLSSSLLVLLRLELFRPRLVSHPLFRLWGSMDLYMMRRLCYGIEFTHLRAGDDLFSPGIARACAYRLVGGNLQYVQEPDTSPADHTIVESVEVGEWLCEAALWSKWIHVGTAIGYDSAAGHAGCRLMQVGFDAINEAMTMRHSLRDIVVVYAAQFHRCITHAKPPHSKFPTDLFVPFTDYEDIVSSMSITLQESIGRDALRQLDSRMHWRGHSHALHNLRSEVSQGKSLIMVDGAGEVLRVVAVMALRIQNDEGQIFVQLGKYDRARSSVVSACYLPGGKQDRGETGSESARRLLEMRLKPLKDVVEFTETDRQVECKQSKEFGVRTKYLRTVCAAKLLRDFEAPRVHMDSAGVWKSRDIYIIPLDDGRSSGIIHGLYAWLTQAEFAEISGGLGEAWMTEYLEGLEAQLFDGTDSVAPSKVSPDASKGTCLMGADDGETAEEEAEEDDELALDEVEGFPSHIWRAAV